MSALWRNKIFEINATHLTYTYTVQWFQRFVWHLFYLSKHQHGTKRDADIKKSTTCLLSADRESETTTLLIIYDMICLCELSTQGFEHNRIANPLRSEIFQHVDRVEVPLVSQNMISGRGHPKEMADVGQIESAHNTTSEAGPPEGLSSSRGQCRGSKWQYQPRMCLLQPAAVPMLCKQYLLPL